MVNLNGTLYAGLDSHAIAVRLYYGPIVTFLSKLDTWVLYRTVKVEVEKRGFLLGIIGNIVKRKKQA